VLLSRVLGYVREMLLAYRSGASAATDAFYAAFQLPDLLNYFLAGGALSIAFIPLYNRLRVEEGQAAADDLVISVLGTLGGLAVVATLVLTWQADDLVALQFPRFDAETQRLTVHLTRIVLPAQIFFITGGIVQAVLLAQQRFLAAALAPLLYNAGTIAGGLFLAPALGVEGFAWGALAGSVLGPFLAPIYLGRGRVPLRARFALFERRFLVYLALAAPLMFGQTLLTLDEWYDRWFGALLATGTVAHLAYARRLMQVPVAVVGQAIAAAALPTLARLWSEGRRQELDATVLQTLQAGVSLAVLAGGACLALAPPIVALIYQRGAFGAEDTAAVAPLLALFSVAVPAWVTQQIAVRAFYARGDTWRPMLLGTLVALGAIPLYLVLSKQLGAVGLALAGAIAMSVNAGATLALARRLHGAPPLGRLLTTTARAMAIVAPAAVAALWAGGAAQDGSVPSGAATTAVLALLRGGVVYAAVAGLGVALFGDDAVRGGVRRLLRRARRGSKSP
jgi:putative peptidoglycan lipid II flippase